MKESESAIKTKFGNATLKNGYYVISSCKEGNHLKFLHRLIFEDFYKLSKGLEWFIVDLDKAKQTITGTDYNLKELV